MTNETEKAWRPAAAVAAVVLSPLIGRMAALADRTGAIAAGDGLGVLSDVGSSLLVLALLVPLARVSRWLAIPVAVIWAFAHYLNYEHVVALGALASLRDLGYALDPTFVAGSFGALARPDLLAAFLVLTVALVWMGLRGASARLALYSGFAGAALLVLHGLAPAALALPSWRQLHPLHLDAQSLARGGDAPETERRFPDSATAMLDLLPGLRADLAGGDWLPSGPRAKNVLLVVLESVSGLHVASQAGVHGREPDASMPRLDAFARANVSFSTFVDHQRKTNRGLYALLCGELPNLDRGMPKMSAYALRPWRVCLPEVLADAGYETVYLQAAPLAFMLKDQFMGRAGFARMHGRDWFGDHYAASAWGVDDRAFFEQALGMVDTLAAGERPWFLTLLNVGTHHPFVVPKDFEPDTKPAFRRSAAYLDAALGPFLEQLETSGVLDDTLLVVTSDESIGIGGLETDPVFKILSQNWGFLAVRLPQPMARRVDAPFAQMDIALSILDYLGLGTAGGHLFGRSIFRDYAGERALFFANVNLRSAGSLDGAGRVRLCLNDYQRCMQWAPPGRHAFAAGGSPIDWDAARDGIVRRLAARSAPVTGEGERRFEFLVDPVVVVESGAPRILHGGQYVDVSRSEWLEVEYEVTTGAGEHDVHFRHVLAGAKNAQLLRRDIRVAPGRTLRLRYTLAPERDQHGLQVKTIVSVGEGGPVTLRHGPARMEIRREGPRPGPGVQIQEMEIRPAS